MVRVIRFVVAALALAILSARADAQNISFGGNLNTSQQSQITQAQQQALNFVQNALNYLRAIGPSVITGQSKSYNQSFGQFYDQSTANPLRGSYDQLLKTQYASADRDIFFSGLDNFAQFSVLGNVLQNRYPFDTTTGNLTGSVNLIYAHRPGTLYGPLDGIYNLNPQISTTVLTFTPPTNQNINIGNFTRSAFEITDGVWSPAGSGPPILLPVLFDHHYVSQNRLGLAIDPSRYQQLVNILTDIRDALQSTSITYDDDLDNNIDRARILAILGSSIGNVTRGFSQYGNSTSGSSSYQDNQFARQLNAATRPLEWWEDTGKRDALGNLLPGERNNFFEDKFGLLFDDDTGVMYVGQSALNGIELTNDNLSDTSNNSGQFQQSLPLWQQIIAALADGLVEGGREMFFGMNEISANAGNSNVDGITGQNNLFPQDRDILGLLSFILNSTVQSQGATQGGAPPGKILNAAPSMNNAFSSDGIIVPLN